MATVRERPEAVWLRVGDVAKQLGVSPNTVRRWTDVGRIAAHRSPGGHRRYLADDVYALLPQDESQGAVPGDFAHLRRQTQDLRFTLQAGLDLMSLLADDPHAVPAEAARIMCDLTGAPRCDIFFTDGDQLRLAVSIDGGELDPGRLGSTWVTADWTPADGDPAAAAVTCLRATDKGLSRRARLAMQRRGCRSLAWAPLVLHGELVGAIELSDAGDRDFSEHADVLGGLARVCAEAVAIRRTVDELAHRDRSVRELVDLSREVAQTHDFERFVLHFAQRLLTAANADCVDVWRAGGGVIRTVVSCTRDGADPDLRDKILDTSRYPSLERTLLDHTPLAICDLRDDRLGADEIESHARVGLRQLAHDAPGRRRGARRTGGHLRRRRAGLERRPRVPHQRVPARRRGVRQQRAPRRGAGDRPVPRGAHRARRGSRRGRGAGATSPNVPRRGCAAPWTAATATSGGSKRATCAAWPAWTSAASTRACAATS